MIDAWRAAITAVANAPTLTYDEPVDPDECVRITVTRAVRESLGAATIRRVLGFRLTTECVSITRDNVQDMRDAVRSLQDRELISIQSSPLEPDGESDDPEKDEGGHWVAFDSWLYFAPNPDAPAGGTP